MLTFAPICARFRAILHASRQWTVVSGQWSEIRKTGIREQARCDRGAVGRRSCARPGILRDFINATLGFPELAANTGIHVKMLHQMFGPKGNPTAANLFNIIACLQEQEGVRLRVVA